MLLVSFVLLPRYHLARTNRTEPPVSEPSAVKAHPVATDTALPPELPPGVYQSSSSSEELPASFTTLLQGLRTAPW